MKPRFRVPLLPALLLVLLCLPGCDLGSTAETAILNENSPVPPTIEYSFHYTSEDVNDGQIEVASEEADNLSSILTINGFSRSDVVSARVDSVRFERLSSPTSGRVEPKVFEYLVGAEVYLGSDASGPLIAADQFQTTNRSVKLEVVTRDVTSVVTQGQTQAFLRLDTSDSNSVPSDDRVRATVYYQLEVRGV